MKVWKTKRICLSIDAGNCVKLRAKFSRNREKKTQNFVFDGFPGAAAG